MSRRMKIIVCVMGAVVLAGGMCQMAWADAITLSDTQAILSTDTYDMSGYTDWYLASDTHKSGTAISYAPADAADYTDSSFLTFTYTGGSEQGHYRYVQSGAETITIPVASGAGQVILWGCYDTSALTPASVSADFSVTTGVGFTNQQFTIVSGREKFVLDFNSSQAQDVVLTLNRGGDNQYYQPTNVGFSGVALSQVPEPSSIALLATGLIGLLAYAWRKCR